MVYWCSTWYVLACFKMWLVSRSSFKLLINYECFFFQVDKDLLIYTKYDSAVSIGGTFLTSFLNKCRSRSEEIDFRPLFENFVHDLLSTVNKPEWPATELLLSLLGTMLVSVVIK